MNFCEAKNAKGGGKLSIKAPSTRSWRNTEGAFISRNVLRRLRLIETSQSCFFATLKQVSLASKELENTD